MGDPKKLRKKYSPPRHPWQGARIASEKILVEEYGLKNKREIYKAQSLSRRFTKQAKNLIAEKTEQSQIEKKQLFSRLSKLNLLSKEADLDNVLGLTLKDILDRRLQTLVYKKKLSKTVKQARQFISHGNIAIRGQRVNSPSYLVKLEEENDIDFVADSSLSNKEHPERVIKEKVEVKKEIKRDVKER